jgi:hypothetical protein
VATFTKCDAPAPFVCRPNLLPPRALPLARWVLPQRVTCGRWRVCPSGRSPYRHHAEPRVEVYVNVQNQPAWPSGKRAKFSHGPRDNRDAGFNFDPQVIAVAEEMLLHRLDGLD